MQITIVLGLLILAIVMFAMEKLSVDIITLLLLLALVGTGVLTPAEAFAGFSNDIIIILASIFVISSALQQSGVMDALGDQIHKVAGKNLNWLLLALMTAVGSISAFMNNTTVTAVFLPPAMGIANQAKVSPSKLLMPLAYASILGGTCTLIGTSTNVAVSGYIAQAGMRPLGLFELTPLGLILMVTGMGYMLLIGQRLLPDHRDESLTEEYAIREYLSEIIVVPESHLIGQKIFESDLAKLDFQILAVLRGNRKILPTTRTLIKEDDVLVVKGKLEELLKVKRTTGIEIKADLKLGDLDLQSEDIKIAEAMIIPGSDLIDRTLQETNFRQRFGLTALAIYRHGRPLQKEIGRIRLQLGDLLLVQGPAERLKFLRRHPHLSILGESSPVPYRQQKGIYTVAFFLAAIIIGGLGWLPLSICFLAAAVLTIVFRSITIEQAYEYINWKLLILIGGMTAFGVAMEKSGAAEFLANGIINGLRPYGVMAIMAGFFVLTILLTQPMSNAAAALVVLPVALNAAKGLGVSERTFAIAVMLAASISFIAPFEPSCILVYAPGKYKFMDFIKTGLWLTLILMVIVLGLIPLFWPL